MTTGKPMEGEILADAAEVLIVDDEPAVLEMLDMALSHFGFAVRQARNGEEAMRLYERHRESIEMVLLDVRMPGMDGPQTLAALQTLNPNVRICFMSGHTGEYSEADLLSRGAARVLDKPFASMKELAHTLWHIAKGRT